MKRKKILLFLARQLIPNVGTIVIVLAFLWAQQAGALGFLAPEATSTTTISYQGRLSSNGIPVNGNVGITFRIYNTSSDGSPLWTEIYPAVSVSDGLFNVLLGSVTPLPNSLFSSNDTLYLGVTVGLDSEMTPREQLASAPWAIHALNVADGSITTDKIADGAVTTSQIANNSITPEKLSLLHGSRIGTGMTFSLTTQYQTIPGLSIVVDLPTAQTVRLDATVDTNAVDTCIVGYIYVDGNIGNPPFVACFTRVNVVTFRDVSLAAGVHTFEVKAHTETSSSASFIYPGNSAFNYIAIAP